MSIPNVFQRKSSHSHWVVTKLSMRPLSHVYLFKYQCLSFSQLRPFAKETKSSRSGTQCLLPFATSLVLKSEFWLVEPVTVNRSALWRFDLIQILLLLINFSTSHHLAMCHLVINAAKCKKNKIRLGRTVYRTRFLVFPFLCANKLGINFFDILVFMKGLWKHCLYITKAYQNLRWTEKVA